MVKVYREYVKKPIPERGAPERGWYFMIWYRKSGKVYSKEYPDRASLTSNPFLQKIYKIEDSLYFFKPKNYKQFDEQINQIIDSAIQLSNQERNKAESYPEGTPINFLLNRRGYFLETFAEKLLEYKKTGNVQRDIKMIKQTKLLIK